MKRALRQIIVAGFLIVILNTHLAYGFVFGTEIKENLSWGSKLSLVFKNNLLDKSQKLLGLVFGSMGDNSPWLETSGITFLKDETNDVRIGASGDMYVDSSAHFVGFGTTTPASRVVITDSTANTYQLSISGSGNIGDYGGIAFTDATGSTKYGAIKFMNDGAGDSSIRFLSWAGVVGGTEVMHIKGASGNVGFGVVPTSKLHIVGSDSAYLAFDGVSFGGTSNGSARLVISSGASSGATAGGYMSLRGNLESWVDVVANNNTSGSRWARFGNGQPADTFSVQVLNDAGNAILRTPLSVNLAAPNGSLAIGSAGLVTIPNISTTNINLAGNLTKIGPGATPPNATLSLGNSTGIKNLIYDGGTAAQGGNGYFSAFGIDKPNANDFGMFTNHGGSIAFGKFTNGSDLVNYTLFGRFNTTGLSIGNQSPSYSLDILSSSPIIRIADNATNSTIKYGLFIGSHYTNTEEKTLAFKYYNSSTANLFYIGGGDSSYNTATELDFYTAANNTTVTGTQRMKIDSSGNVNIANLTASQAVFTDASNNLVSSGVSGLTSTINVRNSTGEGTCTISVTSGLITATTCP